MAEFNLAALPDDIIHEICTTLCPHCRRCTHRFVSDEMALVALCEVARRFRCIAQPVLYHYFTSRVFRGTSNIRRMLLFLRTLVEQPNLASMVRYLHIVAQERSSTSTGNQAEDLLNMSENIITEACARLGIAAVRITHLDSLAYYTVIQLLIAHLPRCELLYFGEYSTVAGPPVQKDLQVFRLLTGATASTDPSRFQLDCLKRIEVFNTELDEGLAVSLWELSDLFVLAPNLQCIEGSELRCEGGPDSVLSIASVVELRINWSELSYRQLDVLLDSCAPLRIFSFSFDYKGESGHRHPSPRQAVRALLRRHRATLEFLSLFSHSEASAGEQVDTTLKPFPRLAFLEVDAYCFGNPSNLANDFLVRLLPESLQSFTLVVAAEHRALQKHLRRLSQSRHLFKELQHVKIWGACREPWMTQEDTASLEGLFKEVGIKFTIKQIGLQVL
ncbi:hypothetical protein C8A03DRAFT_33351 [Achaetomium macrosporum]|uniref:Uncharacterized protein n=1 Tax=Achaetomium macrosporum TaxID=79813 RepID=A0AAN7CCR1_9PEZI|nr:hypothetical protein C8A03DRAFT_33351 [Achaetomium macrosporum]